MTEHLFELFGLYGGTLVIGFIAGMFPIVSIEVFLGGINLVRSVGRMELVLLVLLAATGHQIAKTLCYYAGAGTLEQRRIKPYIDRARARIERWNKHRYLVFTLAATVGLPPMYVVGFIARPLMSIRFVPFTLICFFGRVGRYATIAVVVRLLA